jgi:hypothetical protein
MNSIPIEIDEIENLMNSWKINYINPDIHLLINLNLKLNF